MLELRWKVASSVALSVLSAWPLACGGDVESDGNARPSAQPTDAGTLGTLHPDAGFTACGELAVSNALDGFRSSIGLYAVVEVKEECTNLGGIHMVLRPIKACGQATTTRYVAWGGHGCRSAKAWRAGDLVVIGVEGTSRPRPPNVCLDDLPTTDGVARAFQPVDSPEAGDELLRKYGC